MSSMSGLTKQNIVVPVDFSGEAAHALATALEMTGEPSHVHSVHVLFPLDSVSPGVVWGDIDDTKREQAVREHFGALLTQHHLPPMTLEVRFGSPGLEIAEYAEGIGAELIIIPSHGYHGVKRIMLGSVTERVIRHAHCSVLVLRRSDAD